MLINFHLSRMTTIIKFIFVAIVVSSIFESSQSREISKTSQNGEARMFPCPGDDVIDPCQCWYEDTRIFLDCSSVASEERLAEVFQQVFLIMDLDTFIIESTTSLVNLNFDTNGVTFKNIKFYPGPSTIESISASFFAESADTLESIKIQSSNVTTDGFPFSSLGDFSKIREVSIDGSNVESIPQVESSTMQYFGVRNSKVTTLTPGTFDEFPSLSYLSLEANQITEIPVGIFNKLSSLEFLNLDGNSFTELKEGTIPFFAESESYFIGGSLEKIEDGAMFDGTADGSAKIGHLYMDGNRLSVLEAGSIAFVSGTETVDLRDSQIQDIQPEAFRLLGEQQYMFPSLAIRLDNNKLTELKEETFAPFMSNTGMFYLAGNPLTCGCDIAWIVTNQNYSEKISIDTTCADGSYFGLLQPEAYETFC